MKPVGWPPRRLPDLPEGVIPFDGVCVLCSRWVRFVLARDTAGRFSFAPMQAPFGAALARRLGIDPAAPETNALTLHGVAWFKADAAIEVLRHLPGWSSALSLRVLPRPLRDWSYDRVARNRYRLFGRTESCLVPTPEVAARFRFEA